MGKPPNTHRAEKQHQTNATATTATTTGAATTGAAAAGCGYKKLRNQKSATKYVVAPNKGANKRQWCDSATVA